MKKSHMLMAVAILAFPAASAMAVIISPGSDSFGELSQATFGGSGIPNDDVAISTVNSGNYTITLGLTVHQRYSNPAPVNDGAGTFWAVSGGDGANGQPGYARWNVGYYIDFTPNLGNLSGAFAGYETRLYFDKDPAVGNDVTSYVPISPNVLVSAGYDSQNSWNLGMFLPFGIIDPTLFNPAADGEYGFMLGVYKDGSLLDSASVLVNVNGTGTPSTTSVPDGGSTGLMLSGVGVIGMIGRRIQKRMS